MVKVGLSKEAYDQWKRGVALRQNNVQRRRTRAELQFCHGESGGTKSASSKEVELRGDGVGLIEGCSNGVEMAFCYGKKSTGYISSMRY